MTDSNDLKNLTEKANQATTNYCIAKNNYHNAVRNNDDNAEELYDESMRLDRVRLDYWSAALKHIGIK